MVYTEIKEKNGKKYFYRVINVRKGKNFKKKRIYLGVDLAKTALITSESKADKELSILSTDAFIHMEDERILLKRLDKDLQETSRIESDYSQTGNVYSRIFQEIDPFDTQQSLKNIDEQIAILNVIDQIYHHHEQ